MTEGQPAHRAPRRVRVVLRSADGHRSFTNITNPPVVSTSTCGGPAHADRQPQFPVGAVSNLFVNQYDSPLPADAQWNGGVHWRCPVIVARRGVNRTSRLQHSQ
jgi:hypothetical protein